MFFQKWLIVIVLIFFTKVAFTQQLVLGNTPYAMKKSAVLELNTDNQGLLLPRISDTAAINSLNPPDGMVIYFVPTKRLLLRISGYWSSLAPSTSAISVATGSTGTDFNVSGSPVSLGGTVTFNFPSASASARGLLTSTDWNTFNSKQAALTFGNLTSATTGITITGGNGAVIGGGAAINIQDATSLQNGLLTSTDWNIFNNKVGSTRTINTTAPLSGGGDLSANRTLSMTQANATTNGWLSSTDWNTFNNKQAAGNYLTGLTGDVTATGPGSVAATIATNAVSNAKFRQSAALSVVGNATNATANVADITAANDGEVLRRSGTTLGFGQVATAGISNSAVTYQKIQNVSTNNRLLGRATTGAGVVEEITIGAGLTLSGTTLSANSVSGTLNYVPKFTSTTTLGNSLIFDNGTNVGISTTSPAQKLDVNGNVRFSGALMPAGDAGTDGYVLRSRGAGTAPDWLDLGTIFPSAWQHNGNAVPNEKLFGTKTPVDLPIITNDIERMRITATGYIGINSSAPGNHLEVGGTVAATGVSGFRLRGLGTATAGAFNNKVLSVNSSGDVIVTNGPSGGVSSVGLSLPSIFTVTNSPVTGTGTLTGTLASQAQNLLFASPNGASGTPSFRAIVKADLPATVVYSDQSNTYTAGMKQTFRGNTTTAGINFGGALTADPTTLAAGDLWYRSDLGRLKIFNGTTSRTIATEESIAGTLNYIPKFTPNGSSLGNSQVFDNGTNVGINTASPNSTLTVNGSLTVSYKTVSTAYTILSTDYVIINTGAAVTWTLPLASSCAGRVYRLINQGTGVITLSQAVRTDGSTTTASVGTAAGSNMFEILSDGTEWRQIK